MQANDFSRAFAVWYRNVERWDVTFFRQISWHWAKEYIVSLKQVLERKKIEISRGTNTTDLPIIGKISFGGAISITNENERKGYKGRLFWAHKNDLIYSKIRVKQGSLAIVPEDIEELAVSAEYPVYSVRDIINAKYLELVLRSKPFLTLLDGLAHGGSTKTRIPPEDFERLEIPLPPLDVQHAIVARWQEAQKSAREADEKAKQMEADTEINFLADLGTKSPKMIERPKFLVVDYAKLERWGVRQVTDKLLGLDYLPETKFRIALLGDYATVSYGIQKSPANRPGQHARPYLRVANVRKGYLDLTEIKEINVPDAEMDYYRLEPGDILFVEGNGSRAELGRVGMWKGEIENCVHQNHLIKVRVNLEKLNPEYVMTWFNTELGRGHFFRSAKTSSGLGTINSREVREAPIPIPPLDMQQAILERVHDFRAKVEHQRVRAKQIRQKAESEVEAMILGTKPV